MTNSSVREGRGVWAFFGFGMSPFLLREMISSADQRLAGVEWAVILPTSHHRDFVSGLDKIHDLLVVESECKSAASSSLLSVEFSDSEASWSVFRDLDAEKFVGGRRKRDDRERELVAQTLVVRKFLEESKPSLILFPQPIETPLGMLIHREAVRLSIKVAIPYHMRLWDRSYFSASAREVPSTMSHLEDCVNLAHGLDLLARRLPLSSENTGLSEELMRGWTRKKRFVRFLSRFFTQKEARRISSLRISLFSGWVPWLWKAIQRFRRSVNGRLFNLAFDDLEGIKFIFFPLQYTPESSINVPEPFFIDQMRVIDAVRYSMPSDHILVVKEHPAAIGVRNSSFIKKAMDLPGVRVIKWNSPTQDLIRLSALTVTVTGTAALEAFLNGKPSIVFAPTFFSDLVGGIAHTESLQPLLVKKMSVSYSSEEVESGVKDLLAKSRSFVAVAPEARGGITISHSNVDALIDALVEWWDSCGDAEN